MSDFRQTPDASREINGGDSGFADCPTEADPQPSAGELLRHAREAAGLHIAALAVSLKVPVKKLEALEQDRVDLLPDAVFARALAASVCRNLKIDPAFVLARLPQTGAPALKYRSQQVNTPFRSPGDRAGPSIWAKKARPAVLAGLVLVLGTLALLFLPALKDFATWVSGSGDVPPVAAEPNQSAPLVLELTGARLHDATKPPGFTVSAPGSTMNASASAAGMASGGVAAAQAADLTGQAYPASATMAGSKQRQSISSSLPAAAAAGILTFSATSQSWVEVTDARGTVLLRRNLVAGEIVGASGSLPMSAVVGRADATRVEVRGKALDLIPVTRDNVARFEVK